MAKDCARCNRRAQSHLYHQYVDIMYSTVYRYCFNKSTTEDILQIAFTKVFANINQYDPKKGSLKTWIRRICINTAADVLKKEAKWEPLLDDATEFIGKSTYLMDLDTEYLLTLIEALPDEQRLIFNLFEIEGYSHEEIAQMININVNSCRVYLSRAKKRLRVAVKNLNEIKTV
ncbi:MAG TPA: RNA polymerase sigma factor [Saprospiraceae bacterium]|nr:RNA polymerase sigma factor [Saprospiraceae bacterium]HMQ81255.1 RNA polymerase sigma factor [Saprospiraceae bacterium]